MSLQTDPTSATVDPFELGFVEPERENRQSSRGIAELRSPSIEDTFNTDVSLAIDLTWKYLQSEATTRPDPAEIDATLKDLQFEGIRIPDFADLKKYLINHPNMPSVLSAACGGALKEFGSSAQLSLQVYRDPEIEDEYLTLYVRQERYDDDLLDKIDNVCAQYRQQLSRTSGWLILTTDFRTPE